jgi:hypothetical protein
MLFQIAHDGNPNGTSKGHSLIETTGEGSGWVWIRKIR